ncbi:MAG: hypothetical protein PWR01_2174 [Clostridiales bacterium]|jgi:peptidoglycan/xylan/chitin deacetylase (PgdA/CDA1 family)|nr:hypothetical protein [Clostridiales bacterium]MDN5281101.1 hypothetical protein [Candidatus Ozemobacter sp.]
MKFKTQISLICIFLLISLSYASKCQAARNDIPSLCYHQVEPKAGGKFSLSTEKFRAQLEYLKSRNFVTLNSDDLEKIFYHGEKVKENSIVITFDDGFKTVYDYAFPIMKEFGFKGIVCVYPRFIGSRNAMSWQQLAHLISEGWSVESHSMTHSNLASKCDKPDQEKAFLDYEIVESKKLIENKLGNKVRFMVWPYGCYTESALEIAEKAGYIGAMTVDGGASYEELSPYLLKRQVVYATDNLNKFLIRLGMRALKISRQFPAPGQVVDELATFSCRLDELSDYSSEKYVLNAKLTGKKVNFAFDTEGRMLKADISSKLKPGNYFIDVYLRDRKTGITCQNGWLFTVRGGGIKNNY